MNWLHPSCWLKRNGWAHGTRTGTLTCRVTPKVNVFELLSHPASWHSQVIQKTSIKWTSSWHFFWLTLWLCGIVSHLNIFILLWCVGLFANCGVMTCHTFKVLRQIYGDKFWSAPELTPQKSLRLAPSFCLATVAWGACIVQGPSWWLMNWLHPSCWLKRNGWAHGTRTGTLTCRVTPKVNVFELLSHPASWHSQVIQKTSIKWTSSWPFFWLTLWLCGIVSHLNICILLWCVGLFASCGVMTCHTFKVLRQIYGDKFWSAPELTPQKSLRLAPSFCLATVCLGSLYCPRSKLMIDELVASFMLVEKKWMGTRNTYWHTYVQSDSKSKCFWTPITSRILTLTSHSENVYQMNKFLAFFLTDPLIVWNCFAFEYFHIALMCWTFC